MGKESPLSSAGSALGPVEVSQTLTNLFPSTKYYYRVIVNSSAGLSVGPTGSFTTAPPGWTYLSRFGGTGTEPGQFKGIGGVAVDTVGNAYVADTNNHRVQFSPSGEFLMQFGVKGSGPGELFTPRSIALDPEGDIWVGEEGTQRVQEFSPAGTFIRQIGPNEGTNRPKRPYAITIGANGRVYVADWGFPEAVLEYSSTPNAEGKYFLKRRAHEYRPRALTTASNGVIYFLSEKGGGTVMRVTSSTAIEQAFEFWSKATIAGPAGLAIDSQGNFLISAGNGGSIFQFGPAGNFQGSFGTKGTGPGQMNQPTSLALTPSGLLFVGSQATTNPEITRWAN